MDGRYNTKSPAVKRLMREAQELSEPTDQYFAQPLDDNLFEWHFTVRGPADSDFENGIYHGRIVLPVDYPMKPPSIIWLTPNGRFETNKKICLSISGHHPESWQPSWSIRTALLAIIGFMPTHPGGAIGSLDYKPEERKHLAKKSKEWKCATCGQVNGILLEVSENSEGTSKESKELAAQINLQGEKPKCKEGECPVEQARVAEIQAQTSTNAAPSPAQTNPPSGDQKGESNNASVSYPGDQQGLPQSSSSPFSIPQPVSLPPWSPSMLPFPMPPMGFPFQYPGAMLPNMMPPLPPMHFPYPPSHYAASTPQAGWPAMHPGMGGMFPGSFPPPPMPPSPASLFPGQPVSPNNNSSSAHGDTLPRQDSSSNNSDTQSPTSKPYTRPPMVVPSAIATGETAASSQEGTSQGQDDLFKELLSKVKRLGSEVKMNEASSIMGAAKCVETKSEAEALESSMPKDIATEVGAESEVSKCLKKTANISVSENGDTNTEDNSEVDAPPIEGSEDARPILEKNACSSTSELEKCKQKPQNNKGLRHRQSVTTSVPTEVSEETGAESDRPNVNALRQRIEAASGDTSLRNRSRLGVRLGVDQHLANGMVVVQPVLNRGPDILVYIMVCLLATTMMILVNRLVSMEWN